MLLAMHHQGSSPIVFEQQRVGETGIVPRTKLPSSSFLIEHQSLTCKPMTVDVRRTCLEDSSYLSLSDTGEGSCSVRRCRSTSCIIGPEREESEHPTNTERPITNHTATAQPKQSNQAFMKCQQQTRSAHASARVRIYINQTCSRACETTKNHSPPASSMSRSDRAE